MPVVLKYKREGLAINREVEGKLIELLE